jgi:DNA-binding CsgD family transcriptional regulator
MFAQSSRQSGHAHEKRQIEELLTKAQKLVNHAFGDPENHQGGLQDIVEYHSGVDYFELAIAMFDSVQSDVLFVNGQLNGFAPAEIDRFRSQISALAQRGVSVSLICHPDQLSGHGRQDFLEEVFLQDGAQVRISTVKLHGMFIFDRRRTLMWSPHRDPHCLLVRSPTIVEPMLRLADTAWEAACDLETYIRCRKDELDEKSPQILQLLSSGCKDEVAARDLGVSVRTYRRYVADLMAKLEAGSRFQAGVRAASLGLISPGDED